MTPNYCLDCNTVAQRSGDDWRNSITPPWDIDWFDLSGNTKITPTWNNYLMHLVTWYKHQHGTYKFMEHGINTSGNTEITSTSNNDWIHLSTRNTKMEQWIAILHLLTPTRNNWYIWQHRNNTNMEHLIHRATQNNDLNTELTQLVTPSYEQKRMIYLFHYIGSCITLIMNIPTPEEW